MYESERLARELFSRSERGEQAENLSLIHPDAAIAPSYDPSTVASQADVTAHLQGTDTPRVVDAVAHTYSPLDDHRIVVEGRVRLRRSGGGFSDQSMVWAVVFRDGLLYRSWALASINEAETRLAPFAVSEALVTG